MTLICIICVVNILCLGQFLKFCVTQIWLLKGLCSLTMVNIVQQGHYAHYFGKLCIYDMDESARMGEECRVSILQLANNF